MACGHELIFRSCPYKRRQSLADINSTKDKMQVSAGYVKAQRVTSYFLSGRHAHLYVMQAYYNQIARVHNAVSCQVPISNTVTFPQPIPPKLGVPFWTHVHHSNSDKSNYFLPIESSLTCVFFHGAECNDAIVFCA